MVSEVTKHDCGMVEIYLLTLDKTASEISRNKVMTLIELMVTIAG
jgi:hypothetical protein